MTSAPTPQQPDWTTYLAECFWPDVSAHKLARAAREITAASEASCFELILVPADEIVLALFQAPSPTAVTAASRRAGLPSERVIEAVRIATGRALGRCSTQRGSLGSRE
jgi:hypothetical protein